MNDEVDRLVVEINMLGKVAPSTDDCWKNPSAVKVIDCVLSLNRNYDHFVVPRLKKFKQEHANVVEVCDLRGFVDTFPTPFDFLADTLQYRHEARAQTLSGVIDYLLKIRESKNGISEEEAYREWAIEKGPEDYLTVKVKGFGLAGFQYLRMLFGASTTKPDMHIRGFVRQAINREVGDYEALSLLESSSKQVGINLRDLDTTIWEKLAR